MKNRESSSNMPQINHLTAIFCNRNSGGGDFSIVYVTSLVTTFPWDNEAAAKKTHRAKSFFRLATMSKKNYHFTDIWGKKHYVSEAKTR